jgi:hypothetical protein
MARFLLRESTRRVSKPHLFRLVYPVLFLFPVRAGMPAVPGFEHHWSRFTSQSPMIFSTSACIITGAGSFA